MTGQSFCTYQKHFLPHSAVGAALEHWIHVPSSEFGQFRDAWVEEPAEGDGLPVVAVYARTGGPFADRWHNPAVEQHDHWIETVEGTYDGTYRTYRYQIPADVVELVGVDVIAAMAVPQVDMNERWRELVESLGGVIIDREYREMLEQIEEGSDGAFVEI